jgi:uncharacterized protein involved in type VI secretion and phage assembly
MHFQVKSTLKSNHNYTFKQVIWRISQQKQEKSKKKKHNDFMEYDYVYNYSQRKYRF